MTPRILLIDDDERLAEMLATFLRGRGFVVEHRADVRTGVAAFQAGGYDAVLLDVMLPDGDGFDVCRRLRAASTTPIIMLTARGDELDRIVGLEIGADDYVPKPFNPRELLARLQAVLRRTARPPPAPPRVMRFGRLEIDREAREIRVAGERRELTGRQFDLLVLLVERAGRVQSREQIMEALEGEERDAFDRSIDVHISRIRAAIEEDPRRPRLLKTVRGAGYIFTPPRADDA
jgi:DNA-binding response OmpR family regulator